MFTSLLEAFSFQFFPVLISAIAFSKSLTVNASLPQEKLEDILV